ncbi:MULTISPECIES: arylamine N-acetyltransferase [unclassified Streptomyces]|uniref:arylamine N-acetyltransferase family protein n=1 Tax=unclassified Streptomyces TaxID=2593676 RepID=UPI0033A20E95
MNDLITAYADRIGFEGPLEPTAACLRRLHEAHLYRVPFENFSMHRNAERGLTDEVLREAIVDGRRGGICFETGRMMARLLDACGFTYGIRLGSGCDPHPTPATHQVFVVALDGERLLFDIGYGARGPRGPLPLVDGAELAHPALSTRIRLDHASGGPGAQVAPVWTVSVKEHAVGAADWQDIYRFVDTPAGELDLEMAHFYTTSSPHSLLNRHKVASIPTPDGRVSVRDGHLTVVADGRSTTTPITEGAELQEVVNRRFGLTVSPRDLGLERR